MLVCPQISLLPEPDWKPSRGAARGPLPKLIEPYAIRTPNPSKRWVTSPLQREMWRAERDVRDRPARALYRSEHDGGMLMEPFSWSPSPLRKGQRRSRWAPRVTALLGVLGGLGLACRAENHRAESPAAPCPPDRNERGPAAGGSRGPVSEQGSLAAPGTPFTVVRRHNHRIELGGLALEVDAVDGGRIVEFSLGGRNILATRAESPQAYGSSFWPSPQKDWDWPPPPELDALPWDVAVEGRQLVLRSRTNARLGLSATQRISMLAEPLSVRIELTLENRGEQPRSVAGWQNTRMRPGGLSFFPMSGTALPPSAFQITPAGGVAWFEHDARIERERGKLFADGEEGWVAHVDGDLLLVKVFPPIAREQQAPGEAEVELYVDPHGAFVEVEQQGPYEAIAPGGSATWRCHWLLENLAPGARRGSGDPELLRQARALVQKLGSEPAAVSSADPPEQTPSERTPSK